MLELRTAEAREARKELEDFSYSVSHDLRAPMRHVNGYIKIVLEDFGGKLDPECVRYFNNILESAGRMSKMLEELTAYSRLGREPLQRQAVPLDSMVQPAIKALIEQNAARNIEWKTEQLPCVSCDAPMTKQLFLILLSNAVKFTRTREVAVIEIGATETAEETVVFVRDNGIGFDVKRAEKLFSMFQRFHSHLGYEGIGSGLAIAQRIVRKHGGRIWAEAATDQGASFYFTLGVKSQGTVA